MPLTFNNCIEFLATSLPLLGPDSAFALSGPSSAAGTAAAEGGAPVEEGLPRPLEVGPPGAGDAPENPRLDSHRFAQFDESCDRPDDLHRERPVECPRHCGPLAIVRLHEGLQGHVVPAHLEQSHLHHHQDWRSVAQHQVLLEHI